MKTSHIRPPSALGGLLAGRLKLALRVLRDGWLILGMIAALLLILEVGYRLQGAVRPGARPALAGIPAGSPLASVEWGAAYVAEHDSTFALRWEPYVYFRRLPYAGRFITVDSLGRRLTPQRLETPVGGQVLFLGGSTMWGSYLRDEHTIPALVARHLDSLPTGPAIEVLNLAEAGYVFTQEVIALSMALRDGLRPDVVVFYDGINDVASMVQQGRAGIPQNEFNRAAEFAWGRDLNPPLPSARADLKAMARLTVAAANVSDLVRRVRGRPAIVHDDQLAPDSAARAAAAAYVGTAHLVEALAARYHFKPIYVWQPTLHPAAKPPTPFETDLLTAMAGNPLHSRLMRVHPIIGPLLDSAMADVAPGRFINLSGLLRDYRGPAFVDATGHNTEEVIPTIVAAMLPAIRESLPEL